MCFGTTVLEAAHNNDIDLEGAYEGSLACSTCHVIVDEKFFNKLEEPSEDEEDMFDLAFGLTPTSRLGLSNYYEQRFRRVNFGGFKSNS